MIQAGDFAAAKSALETSLKRNPGQYRARFLLGSTLLALHEFPAAQDQLEAALLLQPTFEARKKLAEVLLEQGKFAEAREQLEQAIMVQHGSADAYELLARAYDGLGDTKSASNARSRARSFTPQIPPGPKSIHEN